MGGWQCSRRRPGRRYGKPKLTRKSQLPWRSIPQAYGLSALDGIPDCAAGMRRPEPRNRHTRPRRRPVAWPGVGMGSGSPSAGVILRYETRRSAGSFQVWISCGMPNAPEPDLGTHGGSAPLAALPDQAVGGIAVVERFVGAFLEHSPKGVPALAPAAAAGAGAPH